MKSTLHIILEKIFYTLLTFPKVIILGKAIASKSIDSLRKGNSLIILGNGPSLKTQLKEIGNLEMVDKLCVNHFAESKEYQLIKPNFYVLNAPEMWLPDVESYHQEKGKKLFNAIAERTTWPLQLFIPVGAKKIATWKRLIQKNPNISINYFNTVPLEGAEWFVENAMERGWGMPRPHNVLIPSIILALRMKYAKIYLTGADHSWLPEIFVADDNTVYLTQKHFYDQESVSAKTMDKLGIGSRKLHEILEKFTYAFSCYFFLNNYANKNGSTILNATKGSYIDAFERVNDISEIE